MNIRRLFAVWSAHFIKTACRLTGKQGATLAGKAALSIYPPILSELAKEVKKDIFVVCGTNGKTTTNNLLASVLEANGQKVICNRTGSNMLNGVVSAFVLNTGLSGHLKADYACIEIDEASTVRVFPHFQPDFMVLTNLFRDQLDRYGEIDTTMNLLSKAMKMAPNMKLLVNGDDSLSTFLALDNENEYAAYGISQQVLSDENSREIREGRFCKRCGEKMQYHFYHYSQLGDYYCPHCGFKRPHLDFDGTNVKLDEGITFDVNDFHVKANYRETGKSNKDGAKNGQNWYYEYRTPREKWNTKVTAHTLFAEYFLGYERNKDLEVHHIKKSKSFSRDESEKCNCIDNLQVLPKQIHQRATKIGSHTQDQLDEERNKNVINITISLDEIMKVFNENAKQGNTTMYISNNPDNLIDKTVDVKRVAKIEQVEE